MTYRTVSAIVDSEDAALALVITLTRASQWFTLEPMPDDQFVITVKEDAAQFIKTLPKSDYAVVQEGGSSVEIYLHSHDNEAAAQSDRVSCAKAAYRTSEIIEIPASVAALGERFYEAAEELLKASLDVDYPESIAT